MLFIFGQSRTSETHTYDCEAYVRLSLYLRAIHCSFLKEIGANMAAISSTWHSVDIAHLHMALCRRPSRRFIKSERIWSSLFRDLSSDFGFTNLP